MIATTYKVVPKAPVDRDVRIEARDFSEDKSEVASWAVVDGAMCLARTGHGFTWTYEPSPSNRSDAFIKRARFSSPAEALAAYIDKRDSEESEPVDPSP